MSPTIGTDALDDLEIDPLNPQVMYVAEGRNIYRSQNGGVTFLFLKSFAAEISDIAINTLDSNILYVTTSRRVGRTQDEDPQATRGVFKLTVERKHNNLGKHYPQYSYIWPLVAYCSRETRPIEYL